MFADDNLQYCFAKIKVPDDINEVFASLYLSIAGAAVNCGAKSAPVEKYYEFLADEGNVTRLQCRKWYVTGLQFVALTFVDPSRVIADTTPAQHFAEMFIRPESMAEVSSSQGNWLWYADQTLM